MYFMSTTFLKDRINRVRVTQFKIAYICDTNHPSHKNLVKLCCEVHYMWWENKFTELHELDNGIKSNRTRILAIIMLVPKNNPQG